MRVAVGFVFAFAACVPGWQVRAQTIDAPAASVQAQAVPGSQLQVSLLTFGPGDIYFERFGHNAIVVRDDDRGSAISYNYGIFDFNQENFFLNFARGRMQYLIAANTYQDDLAMYRAEGRSIVEQVLALTPAQRIAVRDFLAWNAQPQHAAYRYDYFTANCSTRVRDVLDRALGGAVHRATEHQFRGFTYRMDALRLMAPQPALMLLIDLGLGPFADQQLNLWQESFVPMALSDAMLDVPAPANPDLSVSGVLQTLAQSRVEEPPARPPDLRMAFFLIGLASAALLILLGRQHQHRAARLALAATATLLTLFCGLGGCVMLLLWGFTEHVAAWRNENLLLLDPLCLLLVPVWIGAFRVGWRPRRWSVVLAWLIALIALLELLFKPLPWFTQANLHWIGLWLPIHVAFAIVLTHRRRQRVA